MKKDRRVKIGSVEINYAEGPQSDSPIILMHGLPGRWQELVPSMTTLLLQRQILALDFQGQGKPGRVPGKYQCRNYVADKAHILSINLYYAKELDHVFTTNF